MKSQIFKEKISNDLLFDFLEKICKKYNDYYILDLISFQKSKYHNYLNDFINSIKEYYYKSKSYYINRTLNYSKFITIIRQICKFNNINFTSFIKYNKSTYNLIYHIYFVNKDNQENKQ